MEARAPAADPVGRMPFPLPAAEADAIRFQYELERSLARQLREAPAVERPRLYRDLYAELFRSLPGLARKDAETRGRSIRNQVAFLRPLVRGRKGFLDIGCGDGALAAAVAGLLPEVYALLSCCPPTGLLGIASSPSTAGRSPCRTPPWTWRIRRRSSSTFIRTTRCRSSARCIACCALGAS